jgi:hypothetical protein
LARKWLVVERSSSSLKITRFLASRHVAGVFLDCKYAIIVGFTNRCECELGASWRGGRLSTQPSKKDAQIIHAETHKYQRLRGSELLPDIPTACAHR